MKFKNIKFRSSDGRVNYSVKIEKDLVLIYLFDTLDKKFIKVVYLNKNWLLKKLVNGK